VDCLLRSVVPMVAEDRAHVVPDADPLAVTDALRDPARSRSLRRLVERTRPDRGGPRRGEPSTEAAAKDLGWLKAWKQIDKHLKSAQGPGRAARRGRACRPRRAGAAHASSIGDSRDASHISPRAEPTGSVGLRSPLAQQAIRPRAKTADPRRATNCPSASICEPRRQCAVWWRCDGAPRTG
jgi:hypothetical protein